MQWGVLYEMPAGILENCESFDSFENFDDYKTNGFKCYNVVLPMNVNDNNYLHGHCDCPFYLKNFVCKHLIGLAIRLKIVAPPVEAKNVPLGQKRKRGRPSKAQQALNIQ